MNVKAAEELVDLIMIDDYVARRKALDTWNRRWIATAEVFGRWEQGAPVEIRKAVVNDIRGEIFDGLVADHAKVVLWEFGTDQNGDNIAKASLTCIKATPLEVE